MLRVPSYAARSIDAFQRRVSARDLRLGLTRKLNTEEQETVRQWLRGLNATCEEIYNSFCRLADADEFPGRARLMGHCIRELRIRLLAHFVGEQTERLDYRIELREIGKQLSPDSAGSADRSASTETPTETPMTINPDAARKLRELIGKSEAKAATLEDQLGELLRHIRLEAGGLDSNLKAIAADFRFVTETHEIAHSPFTDAELITDDFVRRVKAFEEHLHSFATARRFVARLETLDDLLDEANRRAS